MLEIDDANYSSYYKNLVTVAFVNSDEILAKGKLQH